MPITFPTPTTIGEQFASGGKTWQWNGYAWDSIANASALGATGATGIGSTGSTGSTGATGPAGTTAPLYQATYYKSANQNLVNPNTDITFDVDASWNNDNGLITHTSGSENFVVVQAGLYQLEFNLSVNANGATWNTSTNKTLSIDITRSPNAEQVVIGQTAVTASTQNFTQNVVSTFNLEAGDIINLRHFGNFATATPFAQGVLNTIDLNTWFSWRLLASGTQGLTGASGATGATGIGSVGATGATGPSANLSNYVLKAGDTMTGKLNLPASTTTEAGLNIGNGVNPTSPVTGDAWISTADNLLKWRTASTTISAAASNLANSFSVNQTIQTPVSSTVPALRVTQRGTGEALRVEDDTSPDTTAFVINSDGKVGIGVTPDTSVCLSLDTTGIKFGDNIVQTKAVPSPNVSGTYTLKSIDGVITWVLG